MNDRDENGNTPLHCGKLIIVSTKTFLFLDILMYEIRGSWKEMLLKFNLLISNIISAAIFDRPKSLSTLLEHGAKVGAGKLYS